MVKTDALADVAEGEALVVEQTLGEPRPRRAKVDRVTDHYAYVRVDGLRDAIRVSKVSGRGTLNQIQYVAKRVDAGALAQIDRGQAAQDLRTAVYVVNQACTGKDPSQVLTGDAFELASLAARLRALVAP